MDKAGRIEPLCAVYGAAALPAVQRALEAGAFAVRGVLDVLRIKRVEAPAEGLVRNVNTDEEWAAWSR
jgi:molybdopterin-guanine dinucleotide biosynthesis protein A